MNYTVFTAVRQNSELDSLAKHFDFGLMHENPLGSGINSMYAKQAIPPNHRCSSADVADDLQ